MGICGSSGGGIGTPGAGGTPGSGGSSAIGAGAGTTGAGVGGANAQAGSGGANATNLLTEGWTEKQFRFALHTPYNLPESARHSFDPATNTHTFWILKGDSPHQPPPNTTGARSELRIHNSYTSGEHQFEADFYVASGTAGTNIMQVFGGAQRSTAAMFVVQPDGTLKHYNRETVKPGVYDEWHHMNVIHSASATGKGQIKIYIDYELAGTFEDNGVATHYFKCGVYNITGPRSETRFRNIKYWVR